MSQESTLLQRILRALSFSNMIALAAVLLGIPAAILGYYQIVDRQRTTSHKDGPNASETQKAAEYAKSSSSIATPNVTVLVKQAMVPASPSKFEAELGRPRVTLVRASADDVVVGKPLTWHTILKNTGVQGTTIYAASIVALDGDDSLKFPLECALARKSGATQTVGKEEAGADHKSGRAVTEEDVQKYRSGSSQTLIFLACYADSVTGKEYETRICLRQSAEGATVGCQRGNEAT